MEGDLTDSRYFGCIETKELKRRVRDVLQPGKQMGHLDRGRKVAVVSRGKGENKETVGGEKRKEISGGEVANGKDACESGTC